MTTWTTIGPCRLACGDLLTVLPEMDAGTLDSCVTDPPYELDFMGKGWDSTGIAFNPATWAAVMRVLKPGAHLLAFGGTRRFHRMACAIEDAGFEIRDCIMWVYGSGFPKSLNVGKAMEAQVLHGKTNSRSLRKTEMEGDGEAWSRKGRNNGIMGETKEMSRKRFLPTTDDAKKWQGWGTALKPAWEPIIVARKPLDGTVAANVQKHGTGAMNIDGCRVGTEQTTTIRNGNSGAHGRFGKDERVFSRVNPPGRWPANLIHDGSEEVVEGFPKTAPSKQANRGVALSGPGTHDGWKRPAHAAYESGIRGHDDAGGSASRFFYCAKASKSDRGEGNTHPTVKPAALMRYLCKFVTPPGGTVLDPFAGSGSTLKAAAMEGFSAVGVELEQAHADIACKRIEKAVADVGLMATAEPVLARG